MNLINETQQTLLVSNFIIEIRKLGNSSDYLHTITVIADIVTPFFVSITSKNLFNFILRFINLMNLFKPISQLAVLPLLLFLSSIFSCST